MAGGCSTHDATANTILQAFHSTWIVGFGIPRIVTSDRGAQFPSAKNPVEFLMANASQQKMLTKS